MKKSCLLLAAGLVAGVANGQVMRSGSMSLPASTTDQSVFMQEGGAQKQAVWNRPIPAGRTGDRTTTGGVRWYDFVFDAMQPIEQSYGADVNYYSPSMWNDSTAIFGYTGTTTPYFFNNLISVGMGHDPMWNFWNCSGTSCVVDFSGNIGVTPTNAYTVDSVFAPGWYTRNLAKPGVVDTLIFAFVEGDGGATSDLSHTTLTGVVVSAYCSTCTVMDYEDLYHDIAKNRAAHSGGTTITATNAVYKFLLNNTDTNASAYKNVVFPRAGHSDPTIGFPVSAGHIFAMTVTFKSGDAAYPTTGTDTVRYSDGTTVTGYKYNTYQEQAFFGASSSTSTTPTFGHYYDPANRACGYWGFDGRGWPHNPTKYYPQWDVVATVTPLAAASAQVPHIGYHIDCPTCPLIGASLSNKTVKAITDVVTMPNPANTELNIMYAGLTNVTVTATLTDVLGHVVATEEGNSGRVRFNVSNLAAGMYVYTLEANGQRTTGRVSVAH